MTLPPALPPSETRFPLLSETSPPREPVSFPEPWLLPPLLGEAVDPGFPPPDPPADWCPPPPAASPFQDVESETSPPEPFVEVVFEATIEPPLATVNVLTVRVSVPAAIIEPQGATIPHPM